MMTDTAGTALHESRATVHFQHARLGLLGLGPGPSTGVAFGADRDRHSIDWHRRGIGRPASVDVSSAGAGVGAADHPHRTLFPADAVLSRDPSRPAAGRMDEAIRCRA